MGKNNRKSTQPLPNSTVDGETIEILKKNFILRDDRHWQYKRADQDADLLRLEAV